MDEDIRKKVKRELQQGLKSEKDVLYFMAEVRKLLEYQEKGKYPTLSFYCNWVLHTKIEDLKIFFDFFLEVNKLVAQYLWLPSNPARKQLSAFIADFLSFRKLRQELNLFLLDHGIETQFIEDKTQWGEFCKHLKEVVMDCPLIFEKLANKIPNNKLMLFRITRNSMFRLPQYVPVLPWEIWVLNSEVPMTGFISEY